MATVPTSPAVPIAVLGAGLTGMSAALSLAADAIGHRLFEKLERPGGHAVTTLDSGYRFDRTGHLLHLRDERMRERVLGWLGDDVLSIQRRSVVFSHGVYTRYPFQANTFGLPPAVASECLLGFVRAQMSPPKSPPQNFEEFCLANFGDGISRHFMLPYNARLWGVSLSEITSAWCQRFVPLPKLEDVVAGAVGLVDRELGYNTRFFYPRLGIGELPSAMSRRLPSLELLRAPERILLGERALAFAGERVPFDVLISTMPLPALIDLCDEVPAEVRRAAAELRCTHLYYLDVALERAPGREFHWAYVPEPRYPFYRVGCYSHLSAALAPPGKGSLYVELADRAPPTLSDVLPEVTRGLVEMGVIDHSSDIAFARVRRIDHAYVIFDHHYYDATATVGEFLREKRVVSAGRYGGWNYSSMEDALLMGEQAARAARELMT